MVEPTKAQFPLPADFADNPTEAAFPRQLIVYDEDSDTWNPTVEKGTIAHTRYLCVSYRQSDFPEDDRGQLELDVQAVCQQYDLPAYWLDYACTGGTQEEKNMDLYRIADVFRGATKTLIMIKGSNDKPHSPGWISWGDRLWTLPEALLCGYSGDKLVYRAGRRKARPVTLREIANHAYKDGDREMTLMNVYSGEPVIGSDAMFEMLIRTIWTRTSGSEKGKEKDDEFTAYKAEKVYALMTFMPNRILPDPNESEDEAFGRLMERNGFDAKLHIVLNSTEEKMSLIKPRLTPTDTEQMKVLDKIPYTGGMRYDTGKRCLDGTRVGIMEEIIKCIDNKDSTFSEKRLFLLTGVAGSGKSTIAHSIASHYDDEGRLGSSFFFSVSNKEKSHPKNFLRTIAKDIAEKYPAVQDKLYDILKSNSSLCATDSIQEQYEKFLKEPLSGASIDGLVVVVVDAIDECDENADGRDKLLSILAKELSALPLNIRIFLTARAGDTGLFDIFHASQYIQLFMMDTIDSKRSDIQLFFSDKLSRIANELVNIDPNWLKNLTEMTGGLFIWASTACNFLLKRDGRKLRDRLQTILPSNGKQRQLDLKSPSGVLYKLYMAVLEDAFHVQDLAEESLQGVLYNFHKVIGVVLVAYKPLSRNGIDGLLNVNLSETESEAEPILSQMGTLLNGSGNPELLIQPLHASFGEFLQDEASSGKFYINLLHQHGEMAKNCLEVMNRNLKSTSFDFKDVDYRIDPKTCGEPMGEAVQYSCRYWPIHVLQMNRDEFELIQKPLWQFLFGDKHLMRWISAIDWIHAYTARDALLSLYDWLKEINPIDEQICKLIWECYHLLRWCFRKRIEPGLLQANVSALPSGSLLHKFYKDQTGPQPKIILGSLQDIRLLSPSLGSFASATFSHDGSRFIALLTNKYHHPFQHPVMRIFDFSTFAPIGGPITLKLLGKCALIAISPDGIKIAVVGAKTLEVWSLIERRALIQESIAGVKIKAAFPSDSSIICCILDASGRSIEIMELDLSLGSREKYSRYFNVGESIMCMAISPNASHACGISESNKLSVWDIRDLSKVVDSVDLGNEGAADAFNVLSVSCDGEYIACGSKRGWVKLWNSQNKSFVWSRKLDDDIERILMPFRPGNKQFVTMPKSGNTRVWNVLTGSCYKHEAYGVAALSHDGRHIVTSDGKVHLIEVNEEELGTDKAILLPGETLKEVVFLPDGSLIAGGEGVQRGDIVIWDKLGAANASRQILNGHLSDADPKPHIRFLRFSANGRRLLVVSQNWHPSDYERTMGDYNTLLWCRDGDGDRFNLQKKLTLGRKKFELMDAVSLADGSFLVAAISGEEGESIALWDKYGSELESEQIIETQVSDISGIKLSQNGRGVVSWTKNEVLFWSRDTTADNFTLQEKHDCDGLQRDNIVNKLTCDWSSENIISPNGSQSSNSGSISYRHVPGLNAFFKFEQDIYDSKKGYVCLANGRRLWTIPDWFTGWRRMAQRGQNAVLYGERFAILFEYKNGNLHTHNTK